MLQESHEYTALSEYNFVWTDRQIREFRKLWKKGFGIDFIGRELDRHAIEIMCLVMDQAEKGYIDQREGGIMGNRGQK
ncbi:hypothetical protein [Shimazuella kribbensis]|uniref:hypothetical protein n=1 Tax=Shimazuella kribbensis TaxID=139808 RepID=UPI000425E6B0|nr:hypothetical protein [Shimazuella kribbensis]